MEPEYPDEAYEALTETLRDRAQDKAGQIKKERLDDHK